MVWGYHEEDRPWHDDINDLVSDEYDIILGFNEPNHSDQSDIPPEVAASAWIELQNMYPGKVKNKNKILKINFTPSDSGQSSTSGRQY